MPSARARSPAAPRSSPPARRGPPIFTRSAASTALSAWPSVVVQVGRRETRRSAMSGKNFSGDPRKGLGESYLDEVLLRIQTAFALLIDDPDVAVLPALDIGHRPIDFPKLERLRVALVVDAHDIHRR